MTKNTFQEYNFWFKIQKLIRYREKEEGMQILPECSTNHCELASHLADVVCGLSGVYFHSWSKNNGTFDHIVSERSLKINMTLEAMLLCYQHSISYDNAYICPAASLKTSFYVAIATNDSTVLDILELNL